MEYNFLFCSVGRRNELLRDAKKTLGNLGKIIATDCSVTAPALYEADKKYIVSRINEPGYIDELLQICKQENIKAITTLIDPEILVLAKNRDKFEAIGVLVLAPEIETAEICFDKYKMYQYLRDNNIPTVKTYENFDVFYQDYINRKIDFPVFVKPRNGSGSVGARKIELLDELEQICNNKELIIQEYMDGTDIDADVYVDTISKQAVSAFLKQKLETKIGGANKTISFKDEKLFDFIKKIMACFQFSGPIDMDFFKQGGKYYLSEINPRFGGAYLHAYGCGIDFFSSIVNNLEKRINEASIGDYEENVTMMMFDSVCFEKINNYCDVL